MSDAQKEIFEKYIDGRLTGTEFEDLKNIVTSSSDDNLWDLMSENAADAGSDSFLYPRTRIAMFNRIMHKIKSRERRRNLLKIVAILLVFIPGIAAFAILHSGQLRKQNLVSSIDVPNGSKASTVLLDGTRIEMNSGTTISYDIVPGKHRELRMEYGEAFFDVSKDPECPFIIKVNDLSIEVLGTSLNVNSYSENIETALYSGSVKLSSKNWNRVYHMVPNQRSVYSTTNYSLHIEQDDNLQDARWKDGYLTFDSMPLKDVLSKIERWYGVKIILARTIFSYDMLTGTYHNQSLQSVMQSLCRQYGFEYVIDGNTITLM